MARLSQACAPYTSGTQQKLLFSRCMQEKSHAHFEMKNEKNLQTFPSE